MKKDWRSEEFRVLVTIGESITAGGWSTKPERAWPWRLAAMISDMQSQPVKLVNTGIGANVISTRSAGYPHSAKPAAMERLEKHVIAHRPDVLTVSYGTNDARGGTPVGVFATELEALVDRVRERCDPVIVLLGPYLILDYQLGAPDWSKADAALMQAYNEVTAGVARAKGCLFVDLLAAFGEAPWMVHYDTVHTNDLGHQVVANRVFEVLAQHCSGLAAATKTRERTSPRWRDESRLMADYGY
jgi:lysophospholipase L1-like esterase